MVIYATMFICVKASLKLKSGVFKCVDRPPRGLLANFQKGVFSINIFV